jgi:hypothetical protein
VPVWRPLLGLHVLSEDADVAGHTVLTRSGSAVIALPSPGSLLRALKLVVEDAATPAGGGGGVPLAVLQEVYALAPAAHNPQVHRPPPVRPCAPLSPTGSACPPACARSTPSSPTATKPGPGPDRSS